jgi:hypothetical protein
MTSDRKARWHYPLPTHSSVITPRRTSVNFVATTGHINIIVLRAAAAAGGNVEWPYGIHDRVPTWFAFVRRYGRYIRLEEDMTGRYRAGVVFFGVTLQFYDVCGWRQ